MLGVGIILAGTALMILLGIGLGELLMWEKPRN